MKVLHTADWHLGARLNRIPRTDDLKRAVEQVFGHCERQAVDVLLIAGDLFHQGAWSDDVRDAIDHLQRVARPFLQGGGTILAVTGNHDHETFSATLKHALDLADPAPADFGGRWATGRLHFATRPTFCRLPDRDGPDVQFVLMPYPTPARYLDGDLTRYGFGEEKHRRLLQGFTEVLGRMRCHPRFDRALPSVFVGHLYVRGATLPSGHEPTEAEDVVCPDADLRAGWAYAALGHVHKPQAIGGNGLVRYSGSIERIRADERGEAKGVVLIEVGPEGLRGEPATLPIEATPFLDVAIDDPEDDLPRLERNCAEVGRRALVRCRVAYAAGRDDLDAVLRRLGALFPRCYERALIDTSVPAPGAAGGAGLGAGRGARETVLQYISDQLGEGELAEAVLAEAERLLGEVGE